MAAANGLLNFGLMTAVLMEGVRDLRLRQTRRHGRRAVTVHYGWSADEVRALRDELNASRQAAVAAPEALR